MGANLAIADGTIKELTLSQQFYLLLHLANIQIETNPQRYFDTLDHVKKRYKEST